MPKPWKARLRQEREERENMPSDSPEREHSARLFAAEVGEIPRIDVHGLTTTEAIHEVDLFLHQQLTAGNEVARIIVGHGTGALKRTVLAYLEAERASGLLVADFDVSNRPGERGAAILVALERLPRRSD